jgi:hypothetical protein
MAGPARMKQAELQVGLAPSPLVKMLLVVAA